MDQPGRTPESPATPDRNPAEAIPTPARQAIEPPTQDEDRGAEGPLRSFQVDGSGEEWVVREGGRAVSGRAGDARVSLALLFFSHATAPDQPVREIVTAGRGLEELTDQELIVLLDRARPYLPDQDRKKVFSASRKKGGKGS